MNKTVTEVGALVAERAIPCRSQKDPKKYFDVKIDLRLVDPGWARLEVGNGTGRRWDPDRFCWRSFWRDQGQPSRCSTRRQRAGNARVFGESARRPVNARPKGGRTPDRRAGPRNAAHAIGAAGGVPTGADAGERVSHWAKCSGRDCRCHLDDVDRAVAALVAAGRLARQSAGCTIGSNASSTGTRAPNAMARDARAACSRPPRSSGSIACSTVCVTRRRVDRRVSGRCDRRYVGAARSLRSDRVSHRAGRASRHPWQPPPLPPGRRGRAVHLTPSRRSALRSLRTLSASRPVASTPSHSASSLSSFA